MRRLTVKMIWIGLGVLWAGGCVLARPVSPKEGPPATPPSAARPVGGDANGKAERPINVEAAVTAELTPLATDVRLLLTTPSELAPWAERGLQLAFGSGAPDLQVLAATTPFGDIATRLVADLADVKKHDRSAGVGMRFSHRLFDPAWLRSRATRLELVGIVNRIDRVAVDPDHCGEVRFVYRLAYATRRLGVSVDSRLPMTVNVVLWQKRLGSTISCATIARRWADPAKVLSQLSRGQLKSVEVNLQQVRWPSTVSPSMAGHAEYLMRVFRSEGTKLIPAQMENMPDTTMPAARRKEFLGWLRKNAIRVVEGTVRLPLPFLATKAISVAPRAIARLANRPFSQLFKSSDFAEMTAGAATTATTSVELLRGLDSMTCVGCHQSRSVAGFHLLGEARDSSKVVDALQLGASPHLRRQLEHRRAVVTRMMAGSALPSPPMAEVGAGRWGEHCSLSVTHFRDWRCQNGLECVNALGEKDVGVCLSAERVQVGSPCAFGVVTQRANPHQDRVGRIQRRDCAGSDVCERNSVGFPGGMCASQCADSRAENVCGAIAVLVDFNQCLAGAKPFAVCIKNNSRPAGLRRCDAERPCRDDYVCAKMGEEEGACLPPYFLFQLRVDGHPI